MKRLINVVIAMGMAAIMVWPVLAVTQQNIHLPANQVWMTAGSVYRSGNRLNVYARCHSVYPVSGVEISDTVKLNKTAPTYTGISIYDGHLSESLATFQFRGNTASEAYAVVSYQGY